MQKIPSGLPTPKSTFKLKTTAGFALATVLPLALSTVTVNAEILGPPNRAIDAKNIRTAAALRNFVESQQSQQIQPDNNEDSLPGKINSYTKGLPHDANGVVDPTAYSAFLYALDTGKSADFEAIPIGLGGKFRNPLASYTYFLEGKDAQSFIMPAPPTFGSAHQAADAIEVLWQALTRDVAFANYGTDPLIADAVADMDQFTAYAGPKEAGHVTVSTLFRGIGSDETVGPYISQFLLQNIPYGATTIVQKYKVPTAGTLTKNDHLTNYAEWLHIQNGGSPTGVTVVEFDATPRYLYNGRALAQYVLQDFVNQAYMGAAQIISGYGSGIYGPNDPYASTTVQDRGPLFSGNHVIDLLSRVGMGSQSVAWYQKWLVHRRARPEVFFGRVHNQMTNPANNYGIHAELFGSTALAKVNARFGTYLLPTANRSGSPLHPSYPAGHALMAGAAVTMMKAVFNGDKAIPSPVQPSVDGSTLLPYTGPALTVEGELNKLASNIALGRDVAGVHFRTDGDLGIALGEEYAISVLRELVETFAEDFAGFTFNKFDGTPVTIAKQ